MILSLKNNLSKIIIMTMVLLSFSFVQPGSSLGYQDTYEPLIPYVNFDTSSIVYDGIDSEAGFQQILINFDTPDYNSMLVSWRHNAEVLHIVIGADTTGWVAIGWQKDTPSGTGSEIMDGANIVMGTFTTKAVASDEYGVIGGHLSDTTDNIIGYNVTESYGMTNFEFTFPLVSPDGNDVSLNLKTYPFFIFAIGGSDDLDSEHIDGANGAHYMKNVYIQSTAGESYVEPTQFTEVVVVQPVSFGEAFIILASLFVGTVIIKQRRNKL